MKSFDSISLEEKEAPRKHRSAIMKCFRRFIRSFRIAGERRVQRQKLTSKDFELPDNSKVAQYDPELVAKYWNKQNLPQEMGKFCKREQNYFQLPQYSPMVKLQHEF